MLRMRFIIVLMAALFYAASPICTHARRTSNDIRREQSESRQRTTETQRRISQNMANVQRQLNLLESLEAKIKVNKLNVEHLRNRADSIKAVSTVLNDSLSYITARIAHSDSLYQVSLRAIRAQRRSVSPLAFIFSSDNVAQAVRRINYLRQLAKWSAEQAEVLRNDREVLTEMVQRTNAVAAQLNSTLLDLETTQQHLEDDKSQAVEVVAELRQRGDDLHRVLIEQQRQSEALDRELQRVIEEELAEEQARREALEAQRRAEEAARRAEEEAARQAEESRRRQQAQDAASQQQADSAKLGRDVQDVRPVDSVPTQVGQTAPAEISLTDLTLSFAAQKGKLKMPVEGAATIVGYFGRRSHSELSRVEIQNNGIDIECQPGAAVRAVHDGTVTMIIVMDGFRNVVLLRHGEYLTVYAGLAQLSVRKGQFLRAGDRIGFLSDEAEDPNGYRLHFEVRHEKEKLDPCQWLR